MNILCNSYVLCYLQDEKNQVMSILAYIDFHWNDYKLRWDPNVSEAFDATYSSRFIVNYDGEVQQNPPGIFRFICKVDVTYYPFDTQTCFLKMGSWTYSGNYINLDFMLSQIIENLSHSSLFSFVAGVKGHPVNASKLPYGENPGSYMLNESIDLQVYLHNGEWDLMNTPGTRVVTPFGDSSYHELYYYIRIRRRTLAYGINLIIPSLVISMMTVLGFTLPPDACEKITLGEQNHIILKQASYQLTYETTLMLRFLRNQNVDTQ
ncbi:unnamed protein product [Cylicostephanus goldi]|uniref:Neurotransmitter-gated ion-channel ligand-binding domain-containing protein n=1 Tax=Cylicostephanus goldi TaxID=71465 RepID=A0A3P7MT92_CYLGO|nr:unnamed protein product [Cylicostephanus goldi]